MITAPPIRRRLVGGTLRRYRENLGYTLDDAARILECDRSRISRIETGQRGIRGRELRELLAEYGIDGEQQAVLAAVAEPRQARGWYRPHADVLPGAWQDYLLLEAAASRVLAYEAQRVPGLLQTPAYARALADADPGLADDDARDRAVEAVLARQKAILGERRPDIHVVIGEAALHQEVGGPGVLDGQLGLLAGVSGDSGMITVQVLPFSCGAHAAAGVGSLAILQFQQAPGLGVVHLGGAGGGVCLDSQADLAAYARVFDQVRAFALSPAESAGLLRGLSEI
ncbi:helix-turn-helix transcriptional regulator [Trebonia sp.]|uniref:helix-turn-helix domain-containing protein n=1 Tax=Trebonia sp. TaxID=2767075 RepID=UPI002624585B|nr:helix-turn-helix transcriptional regulator [Trebonia sp.]